MIVISEDYVMEFGVKRTVFIVKNVDPDKTPRRGQLDKCSASPGQIVEAKWFARLERYVVEPP